MDRADNEPLDHLQGLTSGGKATNNLKKQAILRHPSIWRVNNSGGMRRRRRREEYQKKRKEEGGTQHNRKSLVLPLTSDPRLGWQWWVRALPHQNPLLLLLRRAKWMSVAFKQAEACHPWGHRASHCVHWRRDYIPRVFCRFCFSCCFFLPFVMLPSWRSRYISLSGLPF